MLNRARLIPLIVACPLFLQNLDTSIMATALPSIARSLDVEALHLNLAITSYLLSLAVFLPASGWLADRFGARRVFCTAIGLFSAASALCGLATSLLGVALHFFIAFGVVVTYFLAAGKMEALTSHPVISGLLYGIVVYFFMNYVVIPFSAMGKSPFSFPAFLNGVFGHMLLVGLPCALIVSLGKGQ